MENKSQTKIGNISAKRFDKRAEELDAARRMTFLEEFEKQSRELDEDIQKTLEELHSPRSGYSQMQSMLRQVRAFRRNVSVLRYLLGQAGKRLLAISGKGDWEAFQAEYLPFNLRIPHPAGMLQVENLFKTTPGLSEHNFNLDEQFMICFPNRGHYDCDLGDCEYNEEEIWEAVTTFKPGDTERVKLEKIFHFAFPGCDTDTLPDSEGSPFAEKWRGAISNGLFKD